MFDFSNDSDGESVIDVSDDDEAAGAAVGGGGGGRGLHPTDVESTNQARVMCERSS